MGNNQSSIYDGSTNAGSSTGSFRPETPGTELGGGGNAFAPQNSFATNNSFSRAESLRAPQAGFVASPSMMMRGSPSMSPMRNQPDTSNVNSAKYKQIKQQVIEFYKANGLEHKICNVDTLLQRRYAYREEDLLAEITEKYGKQNNNTHATNADYTDNAMDVARAVSFGGFEKFSHEKFDDSGIKPQSPTQSLVSVAPPASNPQTPSSPGQLPMFKNMDAENRAQSVHSEGVLGNSNILVDHQQQQQHQSGDQQPAAEPRLSSSVGVIMSKSTQIGLIQNHNTELETLKAQQVEMLNVQARLMDDVDNLRQQNADLLQQQARIEQQQNQQQQENDLLRSQHLSMFNNTITNNEHDNDAVSLSPVSVPLSPQSNPVSHPTSPLIAAVIPPIVSTTPRNAGTVTMAELNGFVPSNQPTPLTVSAPAPLPAGPSVSATPVSVTVGGGSHPQTTTNANNHPTTPPSAQTVIVAASPTVTTVAPSPITVGGVEFNSQPGVQYTTPTVKTTPASPVGSRTASTVFVDQVVYPPVDSANKNSNNSKTVFVSRPSGGSPAASVPASRSMSTVVYQPPPQLQQQQQQQQQIVIGGGPAVGLNSLETTTAVSEPRNFALVHQKILANRLRKSNLGLSRSNTDDVLLSNSEAFRGFEYNNNTAPALQFEQNEAAESQLTNGTAITFTHTNDEDDAPPSSAPPDDNENNNTSNNSKLRVNSINLNGVMYYRSTSSSSGSSSVDTGAEQHHGTHSRSSSLGSSQPPSSSRSPSTDPPVSVPRSVVVGAAPMTGMLNMGGGEDITSSSANNNKQQQFQPLGTSSVGITSRGTSVASASNGGGGVGGGQHMYFHHNPALMELNLDSRSTSMATDAVLPQMKQQPALAIPSPYMASPSSSSSPSLVSAGSIETDARIARIKNKLEGRL